MSKRDASAMFVDEWNPTPDEIRRWAHVDAYAPTQDWQLALTEQPRLLVELVDDPTANADARAFLLSALYVLVGDTVRAAGSPEPSANPIPALESLLDDASSRCEPLRRWADRSRELIHHVRPYTYEDWGLDSRLAAGERPWFQNERRLTSTKDPEQ